jgi:hypothetical protein
MNGDALLGARLGQLPQPQMIGVQPDRERTNRAPSEGETVRKRVRRSDERSSRVRPF